MHGPDPQFIFSSSMAVIPKLALDSTNIAATVCMYVI